jgi:flagellar basal-body rod protein FlgC
MGYYNTVEIAASALSAERLAMDVIANNIANANTTRTPEGGAFKRQLIVFAQKTEPSPDATGSFNSFGVNSDGFAGSDVQDAAPTTEGVQALGIVNDPSPDRLVFDPGNPDADARGYVHYPNVQIVKEMVDLMAASRAYEANVAVIQESKATSAAATGLLQS